MTLDDTRNNNAIMIMIRYDKNEHENEYDNHGIL